MGKFVCAVPAAVSVSIRPHARPVQLDLFSTPLHQLAFDVPHCVLLAQKPKLPLVLLVYPVTT